MPRLTQHTDCCGICHVHGFTYITRGRVSPSSAQRDHLFDLDSFIKRSHLKIGGEGRLMEITLTDVQLEVMPILKQGLKERGFKLVSRFLNANSGNYVNVLHLRPHNRLHGSPYWKED